MRILKECYQEALELLSHNREVMDKLAAFLIEQETITGKEFMKIYREINGLLESEEKTEEARKENENQEPPSPAAATDLTAQLQEGLTPQQKDMIISLSGMIK